MKKYLLVISIFILTIFTFCFFIKQKKNELLQISLNGKENSVFYQVEISDTPEKAQVGLMWRRTLPKNQGMLFIFPYPVIIKMWMKNTYIPLDMIFFNSQNQIICLYKNALPLDETIISCPYPALKVLELNAGEIEKNNIHLGDVLVYN